MPTKTVVVDVAGTIKTIHLPKRYNRITIIKALGNVTIQDNENNLNAGLPQGAWIDYAKVFDRAIIGVTSDVAETVTIHYGFQEKVYVPPPGQTVQPSTVTIQPLVGQNTVTLAAGTSLFIQNNGVWGMMKFLLDQNAGANVKLTQLINGVIPNGNDDGILFNAAHDPVANNQALTVLKPYYVNLCGITTLQMSNGAGGPIRINFCATQQPLIFA